MDVHPHPGPNITDVHSLDIFHLNSRSIRYKLNNIHDVADDFHILCFSETHLDPSINSDSLELEGFDTPIRKDRTQHGGGVMVYISSSLKYVRREDFEDPRLESIWVEVKLKTQNILICCFYRSDFNTSQSLFISSMQTSIEMAIDYCPNIILVGDINIDFIHMSNAQLQDCLSLFNLTNVITEPTRIVGQSSTLIDPILVTDACSVLDSGVIPVSEQISDHKATYVSLKIQVDLSNSYYRDIWNYKNADYDKLNNFISQYDWDSVINDNATVDDACNRFTNIFLDFCKECIPRKKVLIRPNDKPWFNSELRYNIRLRDRLRKKAFKTNNDSDKIRYKRQRNRVNNMKKNAKENFNDTIDDILSKSEFGSKTFWQIMGRFMGKSQCSFKVPPLLNADDTYSFSDQDKATTLN
ncbi:MAG: endonuclease/exonuclease/phosphatase family protein, partial [Candidatus Thiodiazotropha sp.]